MKKKLNAHIAVLIGNFFFGGGVVAVKHLTPALMPPLALNVLRVSVASLLFWLLFLLKPNKIILNKKDIPLLIFCGITGVVINQILFIKGTAITSPIHASLLSLSTPIAITIIASVIWKEAITINKIIGLVLGIGGAAMLILLKVNTPKDSSVLGDVLIIINAVSYAFYLVQVKPLMQAYPPLYIIRWIFLVGLIIIVPIGFKDFTSIQWNLFQWHHWFALGFITIGATFLSYIIMMYGVSTLGATITGTYIYTQPIFASIISMILFGEQLTFIKICSAILIFSGVFVVNLKTQIIS